MVEQAARNRAEVGRKSPETQPKAREVLKFNGSKPTLEAHPVTPETPDYGLDQVTYTAGQEVKLMDEAGRTTDYTVVSANPDDGDVFLQKTGDTTVAPSLEIRHRLELALEEAVHPIAAQADQLWPKLLAKYTNLSGFQGNDENFISKVTGGKGKILYLTGLEVLKDHPNFQSTNDQDLLERVLDKNLKQYAVEHAKSKVEDRHPVITAEHQISNYALNCKIQADLRCTDEELKASEKMQELIEVEITTALSNDPPLLEIDENDDWDKTEAKPNAPEKYRPIDEPYGVTLSRARETWAEMGQQAETYQRLVQTEDLSLDKLQDIYRALSKSLAEAKASSRLLNAKRLELRVDKDGAQISLAELDKWEQIVANLKNQNLGVADKTIKTPKLVGPVGFNISTPTSAPEIKPPSKVAKVLDKISEWFRI
ncbi:MAG: hypothetical protein WAZ14_00285 [Patescibacteria group bacterium]